MVPLPPLPPPTTNKKNIKTYQTDLKMLHFYKNLKIQSIDPGELQWLHLARIYCRTVFFCRQNRNIQGMKDRSSPPLRLSPTWNKTDWNISRDPLCRSQLRSSAKFERTKVGENHKWQDQTWKLVTLLLTTKKGNSFLLLILLWRVIWISSCQQICYRVK